MKIYFIIGIILALLLSTGCIFPDTDDNNNNNILIDNLDDSVSDDYIPTGNEVKINEIIENPQKFVGRKVIIDGFYGGWDRGELCDYDKIGYLTESDDIIYDNTGCLYMAFNSIEFLYSRKDISPWNTDTVDSRLVVEATVFLSEGKPMLGN